MVDLLARAKERLTKAVRSRPFARPRRSLGLPRRAIMARFCERTIQAIQWVVVAVYAFLVIVPAFLPPPQRAAHIWTNLAVRPVRLLGHLVAIRAPEHGLVGRLWCGLLCPEGSLSELASQHGRGRSIPHWVKWKGWPFVAFVARRLTASSSAYTISKPVLLHPRGLQRLRPWPWAIPSAGGNGSGAAICAPSMACSEFSWSSLPSTSGAMDKDMDRAPKPPASARLNSARRWFACGPCRKPPTAHVRAMQRLSRTRPPRCAVLCG